MKLSYWFFDTMNCAVARDDSTGDTYLVTKRGLKKSSNPITIDLMWGRLTEEQAQELAV